MRVEAVLAGTARSDGVYRVLAKGCILAALYWANGTAPLSGWTEFAWVPIGPDGTGAFRFSGGRAIPPAATHIFARAVRQDLEGFESAMTPLPPRADTGPAEGLRFTVLTDLHLTNKPWRVRRAVQMAAGGDGLLLLGDLVNDGSPEQFLRLKRCIEDAAPQLPVLAVSGNHDYPPAPLPQTAVFDFPAFQNWLFSRLERTRWRFERDGSGAYAAGLGGAAVIGLNIGSHWRKLRFSDGGQLCWLEDRLDQKDGGWKIVLCHAPVLKGHPQRKPGQQPYFNMDQKLQSAIDRHRNVIFLSGHTHLSCNCPEGCVTARDGNIFANLASLCPTALNSREPICPPSWTEPTVHQIRVSDSEVEFTARMLKDGRRFARGYYRFRRAGQEADG